MAPTASEVIEAGLYLEPTFNPSTLTIPVLLSILTYHQIPYPGQYNKSRLVQIFLEEVQPRAAQFKKERAKAELARKKPSNAGFTDGVTGQSLVPETGARRSSRRLSRTPDVAPQPVAAIDQGKRRRSSAGPVMRATVKTFGLNQPVLAEESEPDDPFDGHRKIVRKTKEDATASSQSRDAIDEEEDNPFSDQNVFQSGPDSSSSPARPGEAGTSKSSLPKKSAIPRSRLAPTPSRQSSGRLSYSAPPEPIVQLPTPPTTTPTTQRTSQVRPPSSPDFQPRLPPTVLYPTARPTRRSPIPPPQPEPEPELIDEEESEESEEEQVAEPEVRLMEDYEDQLVPLNDTMNQDVGQAEEDEEETSEEASDADSQDSLVEPDPQGAAVSNRIANMRAKPRSSISKRRSSTSAPASRGLFHSTMVQFVTVLAGLLAATSLVEFKATSSWIGYCDAHRDSNLRIEELHATRELQRLQASECQIQMKDSFNISQLSQLEVGCLPVPIKNYFDAETCTPCPKHATCTPESVVCHPSFVLEQNPFAKIPAVSWVLDGFPGMGSVALPPKCVPDREQQKRIEGLGKGMEEWLATTRGDRMCAGTRPNDGGSAGEAKAFGFTHEVLRSAAHARKPKHARDTENIDELFEKAILNLESAEWLVTATDENGEVYHAATRVKMDPFCTVKVYLNDVWARWRSSVFGLVALALSLLFAQYKLSSNATQNRRIALLVQEALDILQDQEMAHYSDPVSNPDDFIVPSHLRDLILKDEHSPKVRQSVWNGVQRVVESNSNVRTNMQEVRGDEIPVWQWIGTTGPRDRRRVSFVDRTQSGTLLK